MSAGPARPGLVPAVAAPALAACAPRSHAATALVPGKVAAPGNAMSATRLYSGMTVPGGGEGGSVRVAAWRGSPAAEFTPRFRQPPVPRIDTTGARRILNAQC